MPTRVIGDAKTNSPMGMCYAGRLRLGGSAAHSTSGPRQNRSVTVAEGTGHRPRISMPAITHHACDEHIASAGIVNTSATQATHRLPEICQVCSRGVTACGAFVRRFPRAQFQSNWCGREAGRHGHQSTPEADNPILQPVVESEAESLQGDPQSRKRPRRSILWRNLTARGGRRGSPNHSAGRRRRRFPAPAQRPKRRHPRRRSGFDRRKAVTVEGRVSGGPDRGRRYDLDEEAVRRGQWRR